KGRGPVQRAIRRAFLASGAEVLNSTEIYDWAHGRRRFGRRKSMPFGVYSRTLRTLRPRLPFLPRSAHGRPSIATSALTTSADEISTPPSFANASRMSASRSLSREASSFSVLISLLLDGYGAGRPAGSLIGRAGGRGGGVLVENRCTILDTL